MIAPLEPKYIEEIEDIIENPPNQGKYEAVKANLTKILAGSRNLEQNKLHVSTQYVLASMAEKSLTATAEMADRIHEIRPEEGRIAQVPESSEITALREELRKLRTEISAISREPRGRGPRRARSHSRGRNSSQNRESGLYYLCWCHRKFGNKATKCRKSCTWEAVEKSIDSGAQRCSQQNSLNYRYR